MHFSKENTSLQSNVRGALAAPFEIDQWSQPHFAHLIERERQGMHRHLLFQPFFADALAGYLHAAASQMVSAGLRLGVCGQKQGVALLAVLEGPILDLAAKAAASTLDDLGSAAIRAEIAVMRHETQYSRLFKS